VATGPKLIARLPRSTQAEKKQANPKTKRTANRVNHGKRLYPEWVNASEYRDTDESFVVTAIHDNQLDQAIMAKATTIDKEILDGYGGDLRFICNSISVPIPFLPVNGEKEFKLFSKMVLTKFRR